MADRDHHLRITLVIYPQHTFRVTP